MIYVILGNMCTGKTTLAKNLKKKCDIKQIVTYTNRPKRFNEINGIDYHFVDTDEIMKDEYFGHRFFYTKYREEPFIYAMKEKDLLDNEDAIIIVDPLGVKEIKDLIGRKAVTVLLDIDQDEILKRAASRGDNVEEVKRRLRVDSPMFKYANLYCDVVINTKKEDPLKIMEAIINKEVSL